MPYLLGSIILTSYLTLSFKVLERLNINSFQAIVFNYLTCVITGSFGNGYFPLNSKLIETAWLGWAVLMGCVFISLFNLVALTAQTIGVAVTSVANKLSLIVPFLFSIYFYNEPLGVLKVAGILVALLAVAFTCYQEQQAPAVIKQHSRNYYNYLFPIKNMGIVLLSAVVAWLVFREKLSLLNWVGIGLSLIAIALIAFT